MNEHLQGLVDNVEITYEDSAFILLVVGDKHTSVSRSNYSNNDIANACLALLQGTLTSTDKESPELAATVRARAAALIGLADGDAQEPAYAVAQ